MNEEKLFIKRNLLVKQAQGTAFIFFSFLFSYIRFSLPILIKKKQILSLLDSNQVLVISGETGCGKTTQVPQFILEEARINNKKCNIICTQPRRLAAINIARRLVSSFTHSNL